MKIERRLFGWEVGRISGGVREGQKRVMKSRYDKNV